MLSQLINHIIISRNIIKLFFIVIFVLCLLGTGKAVFAYNAPSFLKQDVTVSELKNSPDRVFERIDTIREYLKDNVYVPNDEKTGFINKDDPTAQEKGEYLLWLGSKYLYSYLNLRNKSGFESIAQEQMQRYINKSFSIQDTLNLLLNDPDTSAQYFNLNELASNNKLPGNYNNYFSQVVSRDINDYYFTNIAYKLIHTHPLYNNWNNLYTDLQNDITENYQWLGSSKAKAKYTKLKDALEMTRSWEFLKSPKVPEKIDDEKLESVISDTFKDAKSLMYETVTSGSPGSGADLATDWVRSGGELLGGVAGRWMIAGSYITDAVSYAKFTLDYSNFLEEKEAYLGQLSENAGDRISVAQVTLGFEARWENYNWHGKDFLMPKVAKRRLKAIDERIASVKSLMTASENPPLLSFVTSSATVSEGDITHMAGVKLNIPGGGQLQHPVSVDVVPSENTATSGEDFAGETKTITFEPGATDGTVKKASIGIYGDMQQEDKESFSLLLHGISGGAIYGEIQAQAVSIKNCEEASNIFHERQTSQYINAVTHGEGKYVAVAGNGVVMVSRKGTQWEVRPKVTESHLFDVTSGDGRYVAVGDGGRIIYSDDGLSWTVSGKWGDDLRGVTYGNGYYVAVGAGGRVWRSQNGANWFEVDSSTTDRLNAITYGNGKFVAVGADGRVITSSNGSEWTARTSNTSARLDSIIHAGGRFLAGGGGGYVYRSTDGVTWQKSSSDLGYDVEGFSYNGDLYVAVEDDGSIYTSRDGVGWTKRHESSHYLWDIAYNDGRFVAVGGNGKVLYSDDGMDWSNATSATNNYLYAVAYGSGKFVAVGGNGAIQTSQDGKVWNLQQTGTNAHLRDVVYALGTFFAVGDGGTIGRSLDGKSWEFYRWGTKDINGISYGELGFLAVGDGGHWWQLNDLGSPWSYTEAHGNPLPSGRNIQDVVQKDGIAFAVGASGLLADTSSEENEFDPSQGMTLTIEPYTVYGPYSGEGDSRRYFKLEVPEGKGELEWCAFSGTGDVDLYVKHGAKPTLNNYDYRSKTSGNDDSCTIQTPESGTWYAMFYGFGYGYQGAKLLADMDDQEKYDLELSIQGNGRVNANKVGIATSSDTEYSYAEGTTVTLEPDPANGWEFSGWSGDCSGSGNCTVTLDRDTSVNADFSEIPLENTPPEWGDMEEQLVTAGESLNVTLNATDAEDQVQYDIEEGEAPNVNGEKLTWDTGSEDVGRHNFHVLAKDGVNEPVQKSLRVYVAPRNNKAPSFDPLEDKFIHPGRELSFQVKAYDPNPNDDVTVEVASGKPQGVSFNGTTFKWTSGAGDIGRHEISFNATDGSLSETKSVVVNVDYERPPLQIITSDLPEAKQGSSYRADLECEGGVSPYSWTIVKGALPQGLNLARPNGLITGTPEEYGKFGFTVRVKDAGEKAEVAKKELDLEIIMKDEDNDGLADFWESKHFGALNATDGSGDYDNDGLKDSEEHKNATDPTQKDTDKDGLNDKVELVHGFDPNDPSDAQADADGDGISNKVEIKQGTDPHDPKEYPKAGDINGDGQISLKDAVLALQISMGDDKNLEGQVYKYADVNGDNVIGTAEVSYILRQLTD